MSGTATLGPFWPFWESTDPGASHLGLAGDPDSHTVRPLHPDDVERVRRFLGRLSAESVYRRYFTPCRPGDAELRRLFGAGNGVRDALVATAGAEVIGLAEGAALENEPGVMEIAVVVADAWQGKGVGLRLVWILAHRAAARGAVTIKAETLADNARMARLLRRLWPAARPRLDGPLRTWHMPIGSTPQRLSAAA